jgi:hypothetical protein
MLSKCQGIWHAEALAFWIMRCTKYGRTQAAFDYGMSNLMPV